jgi:hypothetical protein
MSKKVCKKTLKVPASQSIVTIEPILALPEKKTFVSAPLLLLLGQQQITT